MGLARILSNIIILKILLYASLFDITAAIPLKTYAEAAMLYTKELILTVLSTTPGTNYENRKEVCCVKKVLKRVPITGGLAAVSCLAKLTVKIIFIWRILLPI